MTFSILGYCKDADQVGIGYTTVTLAGGGISPVYTYRGDILVVQAYGNAKAALAGARALDRTENVASAVEAIQASDPHYEFRQIGIMARDGSQFVRTGDQARPWAGHEADHDFIAMGNVLSGPGVVAAMAQAFRDARGEPLAERLLRAIEGGRDAGGQQAPDGYDGHYDERSALIKVIGAGPDHREMPALDLRVDMMTHAVDEMRRMYEIYKPVIQRRLDRARDPSSDMPTADWEAQHMSANPPPPPVVAK